MNTTIDPKLIAVAVSTVALLLFATGNSESETQQLAHQKDDPVAGWALSQAQELRQLTQQLGQHTNPIK